MFGKITAWLTEPRNFVVLISVAIRCLSFVKSSFRRKPDGGRRKPPRGSK